MEKNKYTLITIIVLLVLALPAAIYGTVIHYKTTTNFKRQFKFNGKLYFYENKKLLGTYTCKNKVCDYASYLNGEKTKLINNNYAFIVDGEEIELVNIKAGDVIEKYEAINEEGIDNIYYVMKNNAWSAIEISNAPVTKVPFDAGYEQISYLNGLFVGYKEYNYYLYDGEKEIFTSILPIIDFTDNYVVVNNNQYLDNIIYDYDNNTHFTSYSPITKVLFINDYILITSVNNYSLVTIRDNEEVLIDSFYYDAGLELTYELSEDSITFKDEQGFEKTIELNPEV